MLDEIEAALGDLKQTLEQKRSHIKELRETAEKSISRIDGLVEKLSKVLENGTSNHNN